MNFTPVIIITLILLIITILLAIADKLLVTYGQCKITVHQEDETKEFEVEGGSYLLADLAENKINITSSCAGKATCGYCKVKLLNGGGLILPTEEIFMSREEKHSGTRLACQVKVKDDLEVYIPDFLTTVKTIVQNKTYDTKLRWQFIKVGREDAIAGKANAKLAHGDKAKVHEIIEEYRDVSGAIVPVLQRIDSAFNYLPEPALRLTAKAIDMPLSEVHRIATFYNAFSLEPKGKNRIRVCMGTSCYVKGGRRILQSMQNKLGIKVGKHTEDLRFSLETVSCIGCCGQSPVISVNDKIYGYFKVNMIDDVLHTFY
ncbi:MAG: NADH-quinone oxidoreductase subunit NuoE family protein [Planctomycetota bacterium]|jgi:NADH:ubiquinone oxidoreductase subunit E/ferredoxin